MSTNSNPTDRTEILHVRRDNSGGGGAREMEILKHERDEYGQTENMPQGKSINIIAEFRLY